MMVGVKRSVEEKVKVQEEWDIWKIFQEKLKMVLDPNIFLNPKLEKINDYEAILMEFNNKIVN